MPVASLLTFVHDRISLSQGRQPPQMTNWDIESSTASEIQGTPRSRLFTIKIKHSLEKLCDALLEKGGLVPLSKKCVSGHQLAVKARI